MNVLTITHRELVVFFTSPFVYIISAAFLFITGLIFFFTVTMHNVATLTQVFNGISVALLFVAPLFTMPLLSKEFQAGTMELLLTTPTRDWEVVVGKFLAAFLFFAILITPTLIYLLMLAGFGRPDLPVTLSGYLGVLLLGMMLIGLGILASALATSQMMAAALAVGFSLLFWLVGSLGSAIEGNFGFVLTYLSFQEHFADFVSGLITTNNVIYFLSVATGALFIATQVLQVRR